MRIIPNTLVSLLVRFHTELNKDYALALATCHGDCCGALQRFRFHKRPYAGTNSLRQELLVFTRRMNRRAGMPGLFC